MDYRKTFMAFVASLAVATSVAQTSGNWQILDPIYNGSTTFSGQAYQYGPNGRVTVPDTWEKVWGTGQWKHNGVPVGYAPIHPYTD